MQSDQWESGVVVIEGRICPVDCVVAHVARCGESGCGVRRIGRARVLRLMARVARVAVQRIIIVDMATGARERWRLVRVGQREAGRGVIELAVGPYHRVMTILARRRESNLDVIDGRGGVVVIGHVAVHAVPVGDGVVAVLRVMATGALQRWIRVTVGQQKTGRGVIELAVGPERRIVAGFTSGREPGLDVIDRCGGVVVIGLVAVQAGAAGDVVVAELRVMTTGALQRWI